jgi:hypothetical protein
MEWGLENGATMHAARGWIRLQLTSVQPVLRSVARLRSIARLSSASLQADAVKLCSDSSNVVWVGRNDRNPERGKISRM